MELATGGAECKSGVVEGGEEGKGKEGGEASARQGAPEGATW